MRRNPIAVGLVLLGVLALGGGAGVAGARERAQLQVRHTKVGTILVDRQGYTLYAFTPDKRNKDVCVRIANCLGAWPAVLAKGPIVGAGIRGSLVGKIRMKGVGVQLTYAGHPLYTYIGDTQPAQTNYINIFQYGGYWPAVSPSGREVK